MRETSPAGAGLFVDSDKSIETTGHQEVENNTASTGSGSSGEATPCTNSETPKQPDLFDLNDESNLDNYRVRRSSKLVDPDSIQAIRARAETREHNLPPPESLQDNFPEQLSPTTGSVFFTVDGFSKMTPSNNNDIRSSTPTGFDNPGSNEVPQVFIEPPFSSSSEEPSRIAALLSSGSSCSEKRDFDGSSSDWSSAVVTRGNQASSRSLADELSEVGISLSPLSSSGAPTPWGGGAVPAPVVPHPVVAPAELVKSELLGGRGKEVELMDTNNWFPSSEPSSAQGQQTELETTPPLNKNSKDIGTTPPLPSHSPKMMPPSHRTPPSPPLVPYSAFIHSPQMYRSSVATPHVLVSDQDYAYRPRSRSNRMEAELRPRKSGGVEDAGGQCSEEGNTEFLEDFIDNF